jgi:hypothetical protein
MTEFHLVPDEAHSPGEFALPRSPASVPTGGLCHSTRVTSGPTAPSAFATSARWVLQALPGLLYLTAYPNPMSIIARMMAQRNHQTPPDSLLRADAHRRMAGTEPCPTQSILRPAWSFVIHDELRCYHTKITLQGVERKNFHQEKC